MAKNKEASRKEAISARAVALAEDAAKALIAADKLRVKGKRVGGLSLQEGVRTMLGTLPTLPSKLKEKLAEGDEDFTVGQVGVMIMAVAEALPDFKPKQRTILQNIAKDLMKCLEENVGKADEPARAVRPTNLLYQFKITLKDVHPPIWRRIQVKDCTLDKLHEHIQTAMGWTNSHLHKFTINGKDYGDLELLDDGLDYGDEYEDSRKTKLSKVLPKSGKRFWFEYEYDFGDSWWHDVLFEGCLNAKIGERYPICVEGERACPPEDVGGTWGYKECLEILADPNHEEHREMKIWVGSKFDSEAFDAVTATKAMRKGLPDWRNEV